MTVQRAWTSENIEVVCSCGATPDTQPETLHRLWADQHSGLGHVVTLRETHSEHIIVVYGPDLP